MQIPFGLEHRPSRSRLAMGWGTRPCYGNITGAEHIEWIEPYPRPPPPQKGTPPTQSISSCHGMGNPSLLWLMVFVAAGDKVKGQSRSAAAGPWKKLGE
jgi:hypothetical protein